MVNLMLGCLLLRKFRSLKAVTLLSNTVAPRYNEVSRYRIEQNVRHSEDPVITNYFINNKNIRYGGVTKLNQAKQ